LPKKTPVKAKNIEIYEAKTQELVKSHHKMKTKISELDNKWVKLHDKVKN